MKPRNDKRREEVVKLLEKGLTHWAISQRLGIQQNLVTYYAKTRGLLDKKLKK